MALPVLIYSLLKILQLLKMTQSTIPIPHWWLKGDALSLI